MTWILLICSVLLLLLLSLQLLLVVVVVVVVAVALSHLIKLNFYQRNEVCSHTKYMQAVSIGNLIIVS